MREAIARVGERLGPGFGPGLVFAVAAVATTQVVYAPYLLDEAHAIGWAHLLPHWALHRFAPALFVALVVLVALRLSVRPVGAMPGAAGMLARPLRFALVLLASGSAALALVWALIFAVDPPLTADDLRDDRVLMFEAWFGLVDWGGLFGWLWFLTLRRREDDGRLSTLLGRQALLRRQVAESRLVVARAQIDPAMVARVLRAVRTHADDDGGSGDAAALIDELASYLRLALDRVHDQAPSLASDLALVRALVTLREAESGTPIALQIVTREHGTARRPANASFLVVRAMLDAALQCRPERVDLRLITHTGGLAIDVIRDGAPLPDDDYARLAASLDALSPGLPTLRHTIDHGSQRHAAHISLD